MRLTQRLPNIANVAAGNTVTITCPRGHTYDQISLKYSGVTLSQLKNLFVKVNGKPIWEFKDAQELWDLNAYYGRPQVAGQLDFWFLRPELRELAQARMFSIGTLDVSTFHIEVDIDGAAAAPALEARAVLSAPDNLGVFTKIKRFPTTFATGGEQHIDNIPRGPRIMALHLQKPDASAYRVELNSITVRDDSKAFAEHLQKLHNRAPVTGNYTHVDFCLEGDVTQSLVTAGAADFRVKPTLDTPGALAVLVEYFDTFQGI